MLQPDPADPLLLLPQFPEFGLLGGDSQPLSCPLERPEGPGPPLLPFQPQTPGSTPVLTAAAAVLRGPVHPCGKSWPQVLHGPACPPSCPCPGPRLGTWQVSGPRCQDMVQPGGSDAGPWRCHIVKPCVAVALDGCAVLLAGLPSP